MEHALSLPALWYRIKVDTFLYAFHQNKVGDVLSKSINSLMKTWEKLAAPDDEIASYYYRALYEQSLWALKVCGLQPEPSKIFRAIKLLIHVWL